VRAYRRAKVCALGSLPSPAGTAGSRQAVKLAEEMLSILPATGPFIEELLKYDVSVAALTDFVSFHLPLATELKLRLLAEPNPGVRAELLLAELSTAKSAPRGRGRRPTDYSDN